MSDKPTFPLAPQVEYPTDYDTDRKLRDDLHRAIQADDPRREAELHLELAHRDMLRRDGSLGELVQAVQRGDADGVLRRADLYAYWQGAMEQDVALARAERSRLAQREAER